MSTLFVFLSSGLENKENDPKRAERQRRKSDSLDSLSVGSVDEYESAFIAEPGKISIKR
jgi:hypothetical protein